MKTLLITLFILTKMVLFAQEESSFPNFDPYIIEEKNEDLVNISLTISELGKEHPARWLSVDPLADKYPGWSPFNYTANNPMRFVDPTGMDWYQHGSTGAVFWQSGSDAVSGYTNIGTNYTQNIGDGISIVYNQNVATNIISSVIGQDDWVSQITNGTNCYQACSQMLTNTGTTTTGRETQILVTTLGQNGRAGNASQNAGLGLSTINGAINNGNPIMVGVDYKNKSPNADGMTDHFIVISGRNDAIRNGQVTSSSYYYYDSRTSHANYGTSTNNTLSLQNNRLIGNYNHGNRNFNYTITTVRRNR